MCILTFGGDFCGVLMKYLSKDEVHMCKLNRRCSGREKLLKYLPYVFEL